MSSVVLDARASRRLCFLAVMLLAGVFASACEGEEPISADDYVPPGALRECTGAYTPNSEICWDGADGGDAPIMQNMAEAEEAAARYATGNRCEGGILGAPGTAGTMTVSFGTTRLGGKYAPRNCGAVWIEDANGFYIRTLNLWANERKMSVVAWFQSACMTDAQIAAPDVNTSATLPVPQAHTVTWDTQDYRGRVTPDGLFSLYIQVTENEIFPEGPVLRIDFMKGPAPVNNILKPADIPRGYENVMLSYAPTGAAPTAP